MSEDRWDEMRGRLAHLDGKLTALVDAVASLRADLMTRIDRLQDALTLEREKKIVDQSMVLLMRRQIQHLTGPHAGA